MDFGSLSLKLKGFIQECKRVLIVTKKPSKEEFKTIVKAAGIGMMIIGAIGFIIHMFQAVFLK